MLESYSVSRTSSRLEKPYHGSLCGHKKELFEESPIVKALLRLAVPTVMGQIILVIYNMADTFFISLTDSTVKITAVTLSMPAFMFLTAVSNLFGIGGSILLPKTGISRLMPAVAARAIRRTFCDIISSLFLDNLVNLNDHVNLDNLDYLIRHKKKKGLSHNSDGPFFMSTRFNTSK